MLQPAWFVVPKNILHLYSNPHTGYLIHSTSPLDYASSPTDVFTPWHPNIFPLIYCMFPHFHHVLPCTLPPLECFSFPTHNQNDLETAASAFHHLLFGIPFLKIFMMTHCCYQDLKVCWRHIYLVLDPRLSERSAPPSLFLHFVAQYKCLIIIIYSVVI